MSNSSREYVLKPGLLSRARKLFISPEYIQYENGFAKGEEFARLAKEEIVDFKHGTNPIVWYRFIVGHQYSITLKDRDDKEMLILFRSYFNLNKDYFQAYADIVEDIWKYFQQDIADRYVDRFFRGEELILQGLHLRQDGILLRGQTTVLSWNRVGMHEYLQYFAIYDKENPQLHSLVWYNEYETETLWSAMKTILEKQASH